MPFKESSVVDDRVGFMADWLSGEWSKAEVCRRYGVSRECGYRWARRYALEGPAGLEDRRSRPRSCPHETPSEVVAALVAAREAHPTWGPRKLKAALERDRPAVQWPAASTIGKLLKQHGLVAPRRRRRRVPPQTAPFVEVDGPNRSWTIDFKGDFRLGNRQRCYPLTLCDAHTRMLLRCQGLPSTKATGVRPVLEAAFREFGLPDAVRSDNGTPFASRAPGGLSALSVWWVRLGIRPQRIRPGHPEENGRHERFHRTLAEETTRPPSRTMRSQQRRFLRFQREFNEQRPHEALGQATPDSVYQHSCRPYPSRLPAIEYDPSMLVRRVGPNGVFHIHGTGLSAGAPLAGEQVALVMVDDGIWQAFYSFHSLGFINLRKRPEYTRLAPTRPKSWRSA